MDLINMKWIRDVVYFSIQFQQSIHSNHIEKQVNQLVNHCKFRIVREMQLRCPGHLQKK